MATEGIAPPAVAPPAAKDAAALPPGLDPITTQGHRSFGGAGEEYSLSEVLGEGSYGSVYRCLRTRDSAVFAAKIIDTLRIGFVGGQTGVKAAQIMAAREVEALRQLSSHANVISLEAAFFSVQTQQVFIVTEFVPGSHLFSHIVQRSEPLKEGEASHITAQLADAIAFCHALGVVHRDLKLENVLVAGVDVRLMESTDAETGQMSWQTMEIFNVKICDFGFAKSLQAFTTRTHVGTGQYAAPELRVDNGPNEAAQSPASGEPIKSPDGPETPGHMHYDAFKVDSYSFGVMLFVMLCLGFPPKKMVKNSHRSHKLWSKLSADAHDLIDGLLEIDPISRLSIIDICNHRWVKLNVSEDDGQEELQRSKSKEDLMAKAEENGVVWDRCISPRSPQPKWRGPTDAQDAALPGVLALHRAFVHVQQERAMACWALVGGAGPDGISCWDQYQWHVQLTEKRISEAKGLLSQFRPGRDSSHPISQVFALLTEARKLALASSWDGTIEGHDVFDCTYGLYNEACSALININAQALEEVGNSDGGRRAGRRYRLFSAAAEQLGRERAFMCGHEGRPGSPTEAAVQTRKLQRLAEIMGARKVLLGTTAVDDRGGVIAPTSAGLLGTIIGGEETSSLCTPEDIARLESLEKRVLSPQANDLVPTDEWYQEITRLLNEIHSRIAISLVEDMRLPHVDSEHVLEEASFVAPEARTLHPWPEESLKAMRSTSTVLRAATKKLGSGCRSGLKGCLVGLANLL